MGKKCIILNDELQCESYLIEKREPKIEEIKLVKTKLTYQDFVKVKTIEFASKFPKVCKKERYSMILKEWKDMKQL